MDLEGMLMYHCKAGPIRIWECYSEHPLSVLGDMIVRIAGTVIRFYAGKREFHGNLDQGDLISERSCWGKILRYGIPLDPGRTPTSGSPLGDSSGPR